MYRIATLVALAAAAPALAQDPAPDALDVRVMAPDPDTIRIEFQTVDPQPAMCELRVNRITLDAPELDEAGHVVDGAIRVRAGVDPNEICPMVVGPERGSVDLEKGRGLPQLQSGRYELEINGQTFGILVVGDNGARLVQAGGA